MNNQKYVTPDVIAYELGREFKSKKWDIGDVRTWCGIVETRYVKDIETMMKFEEVPLTVTSNMLLLPCNVFRILDVYESVNKNLTYKNNGAYLYDFKYNGVKQTYSDNFTLYLNYIGINIDESTGEILIVKGHEEACKTFCKIEAFAEDAAYGRFSKDIWAMWKEEFSGQFKAARYNVQHKSRLDIDNLNIIRGNMIPKIAGIELHHQIYK
jgi:hypothetical protein